MTAYELAEFFFGVTVPAFELDRSGWIEEELASVDERRRWTTAELRATSEAFYPRELPDLLL